MREAATFAKGLDLLSVFDEKHQTLMIREMAHRAGIGEGSVYRYTATLVSRGFMQKSTRRGFYQLGLRILELGRLVQPQMDIATICYPVMEELANETGETVVLTAIFDHKGICLEKADSQHTLRVTWERGSTFCLHSGASGRMLLAHLSDEQLIQIIRKAGLPKFTDRTLTDVRQLKANLSKVQQDGYALSKGEDTPGVWAVSAPIFDAAGRVLASVTIGGPENRVTETSGPAMIELIKETAAELTRRVAILPLRRASSL